MKSWDQIHVLVFPQNPLRHFSYFSIESAFSPEAQETSARKGFVLGQDGFTCYWTLRQTRVAPGHRFCPPGNRPRSFVSCLLRRELLVHRPVGLCPGLVGRFVHLLPVGASQWREREGRGGAALGGVGVSSERPAGSARTGAALHSDLSDPPSSTDRPT